MRGKWSKGKTYKELYGDKWIEEIDKRIKKGKQNKDLVNILEHIYGSFRKT